MKANIGIEERLLQRIRFGRLRKYIWIKEIKFYSVISETFNRKKNITRALARRIK